MNKTLKNYQDLQHSIDNLVGKFGLHKAIEVLENLSENTKLTQNDREKSKLLYMLIISKAIQIFNLNEASFYTSELTEYKEARMACYFILKKYTDNSFGIIGERFKHSKRSIMYHYHKCNEILSIPQYYKPFVNQFKQLEECVINFLAKLN